MSEDTISPVVSVLCTVYNHESCLRDCLEGFVKQKTSFPYECIVHDDASTDASAAIIREYAEKYPHLIKPVYQSENQYSKRDGSLWRAVVGAMSQASGYVAFCEGDDYWCDSHKLQKQVELLDSHPEYSMCCSQAYELVHSTGSIRDFISYEGNELSLSTLLLGNRVVSPTTMLRKPLWKQYCREFVAGMPDFGMLDYPLWMWMARQAPIYNFCEKMAVYRVLEESASHSRSALRNYRFALNAKDVALFCSLEFGYPIGQLWWQRTKFVIKQGLKNRWFGTMLRDLVFPNIFRKKR